MATYEGKVYRLRAASPMPVAAAGVFVLHTFMGEQHDLIIDPCSDGMVSSGSFQGQGGGLVSANYTRLPYSPSKFSSQIATGSKYIEELGV